jgi:hypothetical protein
MEPVEWIKHARLPSGKYRDSTVLIRSPEWHYALAYALDNKLVSGKEPEDGILITQSLYPERLSPEERGW